MSYRKPINLTFLYTIPFTVILAILIAGLSLWTIHKHKEEQITELLTTSRAIAAYLITNMTYKDHAVILPFHTDTKIEFKISNLPESPGTLSPDSIYSILNQNNNKTFHYEEIISKEETGTPFLVTVDIPMSVSERIHNTRIKRDVFSFATIGLLSIIFIFFSFWRLSKKVSYNLNREIEEDRLRALIELAGATAHELRQPLTIIIGLTDLINDKLNKRESIEQEFRIIKDQCFRMDDIIKKMLSITSYKTIEYSDGVKIFDLHAQKDSQAVVRPWEYA